MLDMGLNLWNPYIIVGLLVGAGVLLIIVSRLISARPVRSRTAAERPED